MSGELIKFGDEKAKRAAAPKEPTATTQRWVWTCLCGNSTFQLLHGGSVRCAYCNQISTAIAHFSPKGDDIK